MADDNNVGFFKAAIESGGELQDAASYYQAVKPAIERENSIGLGTNDPLVMRACRKMVRPFMYFKNVVVAYVVVYVIVVLAAVAFNVFAFDAPL